MYQIVLEMKKEAKTGCFKRTNGLVFLLLQRLEIILLKVLRLFLKPDKTKLSEYQVLYQGQFVIYKGQFVPTKASLYLQRPVCTY